LAVGLLDGREPKHAAELEGVQPLGVEGRSRRQLRAALYNKAQGRGVGLAAHFSPPTRFRARFLIAIAIAWLVSSFSKRAIGSASVQISSIDASSVATAMPSSSFSKNAVSSKETSSDCCSSVTSPVSGSTVSVC